MQDSIFKHLLRITSLFVLLTPESGVGVGDLDGQLSCPLHDQLPVLGGDIVGNLSTVSPTQDKEKLLGTRCSVHFQCLPVKGKLTDNCGYRSTLFNYFFRYCIMDMRKRITFCKMVMYCDVN